MDSVEQHLAWCRLRNLAKGTVTQRRNALARLRRACGCDPLHATETQVRDHLARDSMQAGARATELSHLRQFYRWAQIEDLRPDDPTRRIVRPRVKRGLPRPTQETDLAAAVQFAPDRIRPWLLLGAWGGLRCAEIAPLRREHLLIHQRPALVIIEEEKGGDAAAQPIGLWVANELAELDLPSSGYLFGRLDGRPGPIPPHRVSQLGNRYLRSMGIPSTMHQLRHRYGTQALRMSGGNVRKAQELLRHKSIASTQVYTWIDPAELAQVADAIPVPSLHPTLF